jgi:uncharacterized phage infection (PIP) family protein YhgE
MRHDMEYSSCIMGQLLYHGIQQLYHGIQQLYHGIKQLYHGIKQLYRGIQQLYHGIQQLYHGIQQLYHGIQQLYRGIQHVLYPVIVIAVSPVSRHCCIPSWHGMQQRASDTSPATPDLRVTNEFLNWVLWKEESLN